MLLDKKTFCLIILFQTERPKSNHCGVFSFPLLLVVMVMGGRSMGRIYNLRLS